MDRCVDKGLRLEPGLLLLLATMDEIAASLLRMRGPTSGPAVNVAPAGTKLGAPARPPAQGERRRARLLQEFGVRIAVAALVVVFNELFMPGDETSSVIRLTALLGLGLNLPYLLGVRTGRALRIQAYLRMLVDVGLITAGLYGAGGLGAAQYIGIHAIVPVYTAIVFSSLACGLAVVFATLSYLTVVALQLAGVLPFLRPPLPDAWVIASFNLLVLNLVGWLAALLAEAYRASRRRLASLYTELERAHDESLRVNAQIQRASQRYVLSEVVTGVTHDVRDALQGVFGHLWLARRSAPGLPEEAGEQLGEAERACERAMRILSTTLDMARRPAVEREPVALADVARRVASLKAVELRRDGITLQVEVPPALPRVPAAPFQLQQVLVNLVTNAQDELRGAVGRREIAIVGKETAEGVALEVRDTGGGILPTHLPHVFEPFYTTRAGASGLGLALSAGVVESLGGRLTAENRRGGGALFRLTLPAAVREPSKSAPTRPTVPS
ncbi:MAG TPA: HAMP domain-containing sensor histidine kinase [Methylomirabilota bacterium]|nr:HAMP domain-containing sensor histidine kinase [Methylomirabilota bacterium]